jgi:hypothetical protein
MKGLLGVTNKVIHIGTHGPVSVLNAFSQLLEFVTHDHVSHYLN